MLEADLLQERRRHNRHRKLKAPGESSVPQEGAAAAAQPALFAAAAKAEGAQQKQKLPPQEEDEQQMPQTSRPALYTCAPTPLAHFEPVMFGDSHCVALREALAQGRQLARQGARHLVPSRPAARPPARKAFLSGRGRCTPRKNLFSNVRLLVSLNRM